MGELPMWAMAIIGTIGFTLFGLIGVLIGKSKNFNLVISFFTGFLLQIFGIIILALVKPKEKEEKTYHSHKMNVQYNTSIIIYFVGALITIIVSGIAVLTKGLDLNKAGGGLAVGAMGMSIFGIAMLQKVFKRWPKLNLVRLLWILEFAMYYGMFIVLSRAYTSNIVVPVIAMILVEIITLGIYFFGVDKHNIFRIIVFIVACGMSIIYSFVPGTILTKPTTFNNVAFYLTYPNIGMMVLTGVVAVVFIMMNIFHIGKITAPYIGKAFVYIGAWGVHTLYKGVEKAVDYGSSLLEAHDELINAVISVSTALGIYESYGDITIKKRNMYCLEVYVHNRDKLNEIKKTIANSCPAGNTVVSLYCK